MRKTHYCFLCIRKNLKSIHLIDKCLIIFMFILLIQLTISMFLKAPTSTEVTYIDVVIRTSTASIFGYFLSANFIRHSSSSKNKDLQATQNEEYSPAEDNSSEELPSASKVQIIIATLIGLTCLLSLLLLRNAAVLNEALQYNPSIAATVSQFRDFVSGCVGFLIGCPTNQKNNH